MPTYLFLNKETKEEYELSMSISERETYLKDNPHVEQLVNGFPGVARTHHVWVCENQTPLFEMF